MNNYQAGQNERLRAEGTLALAKQIESSTDSALAASDRNMQMSFVSFSLLSMRTRDLMYEMKLKDAKFRTFLDRLKRDYPEDAQKLDDLVAKASAAYEDDPDWLEEARRCVEDQPLIPPGYFAKSSDPEEKPKERTLDR